MVPLNQQNSGLKVCVDQVTGGCVAGRAVGLRLTEPLNFSDAAQLLLLFERIMDVQNFPQAYRRCHTFAPDATPQRHGPYLPENGMTQALVDDAQGNITTFLLWVTRRAATWQGGVDWLDGTGPHSFSSDLELLALLEQRFPRG